MIDYTLDTRRARSEVRAQSTQARAGATSWCASAPNADNSDPQIGRTLFQLLVPVEIEPFLAGTSAMVLELDSGTAAIPWELLDRRRRRQRRRDTRPWAVRTQLLRKLRTEEFREQPLRRQRATTACW